MSWLKSEFALNLRPLLLRLRKKLWFRPLFAVVISIGMAFLARISDFYLKSEWLPQVQIDSVERLLSIIATSMLAVSTFTVASMVSAYASASSMATPRSFRLVVSDDVTQNTLSVFIGTFIFSVVALVAVENNYYGKPGTFTLFCMTALVFALVVLSFVRWIDSIARLGRMGNTIERAKLAAMNSIKLIASDPYLGAKPPEPIKGEYLAVSPSNPGYVTTIDFDGLETVAINKNVRIHVNVRHGEYLSYRSEMLIVQRVDGEFPSDLKSEDLRSFITVESAQEFETNPIFGIKVLTEIACKALSPGINDHGTAVQVINVQSELLSSWVWLERRRHSVEPKYTRVHFAKLNVNLLVHEAFDPICRDGAGNFDILNHVINALISLKDYQRCDLSEGIERMALRLKERVEQTNHLHEDRHLMLEGLRELLDN